MTTPDRHALIRLREVLGLPAHQMAARIGISRSHLQMIEAGKRRVSSELWERAQREAREYEAARLSDLSSLGIVVNSATQAGNGE